MVGIYIHVPFCAVKCPYCDFYSVGFSMKNADLFKDAVIRNILSYPAGLKADTIYFGGGTPSLLPSKFIAEILHCLSEHFELLNPEITLEINPCTVDRSKLSELRSSGINRISVGVQSASEEELEFLGRKHSFEKAAETVETAADLGFENISCDVMIGLPGQTLKSLEINIKKIAELPVQHISSYILKVEKNTPFYERSVSEILPDDDHTADLYLYMVDILKDLHYTQYEISNFAFEGYQSRHNINYWRCGEYIGFGPSAHSFFGGKRYAVPNDLKKFLTDPVQCEQITDENPGNDDEKIMLGLRLSEGICLDDFPDRKFDILKKASLFERLDLADYKNGNLRLTPKGFLISNSIISQLI